MNKLRHLDEFKKILADYSMSPESKQILRETNLVLLVAPTSAGRNTIIRELIKTGDYHFIVSDTTRRPRTNDGVAEKNGVEYWFKSEEDVLLDLKAGKYLEAAVIHSQQVSGISMRELSRASRENKIAITDIEVEGVKHIMSIPSNTYPIFVLPPSFEEWQHRLRHRGEMSSEEVRRRLQSACDELSEAIKQPYYTFVINDTVEEAISQIHQLAKMGVTDPATQKSGRNLAEQLYIQTKAYLDFQ
ncbi:MAG: hypothetical protein U5K77_02530 [Candidatus Saccharibacteria bacterium]|nr:hypothetical protein [Candidatus Saccharibacteria bacterium]